jgi:predicted MFS family arabinose efflux permease
VCVQTLFAVNTCSLFFTLAGNFALFPPAVQRMFGPEAGTVIYGLLYSAFAFASVFGGVLTKALVRSMGWEQVFQVMAAMSLLATGLVTMLKPIDGFVGSVV